MMYECKINVCVVVTVLDATENTIVCVPVKSLVEVFHPCRLAATVSDPPASAAVGVSTPIPDCCAYAKFDAEIENIPPDTRDALAVADAVVLPASAHVILRPPKLNTVVYRALAPELFNMVYQTSIAS